jgi:hypothetical protein
LVRGWRLERSWDSSLRFRITPQKKARAKAKTKAKKVTTMEEPW